MNYTNNYTFNEHVTPAFHLTLNDIIAKLSNFPRAYFQNYPVPEYSHYQQQMGVVRLK